ncbi:MAG TPA: DUF6580 family putative transport protein [Bacteroidia bacterium]|nr:DUF6580 family putative transport protein [Bacteroidia bacterium]
MKKIFTPQVTLAIILILAAGLSRLLKIAPNITAVGAMALFAGSYFKNRKLAYAVPLITLLLTDLILGFHKVMIPVYACFVFTVFLGTIISEKKNVLSVALTSITSSAVFFLVTNLPFWFGNSYPWNFAGAMESYTLALPFFRNSIIGDLVFNAVLFGGFEFAKRRIPAAA